VLLAATHSIAVLVCTRAGGFTYRCALLMTLALASCAFVLSFDALRSLATNRGTKAAPAANATILESACSTAWATLPVTDIAVATINHIQKNRAAPRLWRAISVSVSISEVDCMALQTPSWLHGSSTSATAQRDPVITSLGSPMP
jgi:hypothetical protein